MRKNDGMRRVSLELFCIIALVTLPAYLSGVGTQVCSSSTGRMCRQVLIERHHDAAVLGSLGMVLTGFAAWLSLWQMRRLSRADGGALARVLLFSVFTLALDGQGRQPGRRDPAPGDSARRGRRRGDRQPPSAPRG